MSSLSNPNQFDERSRGRARRFLALFAACVAVVASLVAAVNLTAWRYMVRAENQDVVQLLAGWGRMYKPILYDEIEPEVAVYGASWARDAFDPLTAGRILGKRVFNHAVSGATGYESRRFADASVDNPRLEAAIVNLDTFYRDERVARTRYGFDDSILDVDPSGRPNRWVGLKRSYSLALTGWAAGANLKLISTLRARDSGARPEDYLEAYERADHSSRAGRMAIARSRIFPRAGETPVLEPEVVPLPTIEDEPVELGRIVDRFCAAEVDVYAYFTPSHVRQQSCDPDAPDKLAALKFLRRKQAACASRIHYYDFYYVNAMTLEGVLRPVQSSRYYRPDGHPRPTVGDLIVARMFERPLPPDTHPLLAEDFGVDLLQHPDPESWIRDRAGRCIGDWGETGYADYRRRLLEP